MKCDIRNHSSMAGIEKVAEELYKFAQKKLGFDKPARVVFESQGDRAVNILAPTANYNPQTRTIKVFVDHRHPKDILRSMAHELIHHAQCCMGAFDSPIDTSPGYAQKDDRMRDLERDAYFWGNGILFRDWEDNHKQRSTWNLMNENKRQITDEQKLRRKIRRMIMETLQENDLGSMEKEITGDLARQRAGTLRGARGQEPGRSVQPASRRERERQEAGVDPINPVRSTTPPVTEEDSIEEEAKPDFLDLDGDKDKDEPMEKAAKEVEEGKGHGCASHVKENLSGREGRCINHTLLEDGSVTHYTVEFQNEIVENIPVDRLTVLAEGHHSHSAKRDDYAHDKSKPRMPFEEGEEVEEQNKGETPGKQKDDTDADISLPDADIQRSPQRTAPSRMASEPVATRGGVGRSRGPAPAGPERTPKGATPDKQKALEEQQPLKEWYNDTLHEALLRKFKIKK